MVTDAELWPEPPLMWKLKSLPGFAQSRHGRMLRTDSGRWVRSGCEGRAVARRSDPMPQLVLDHRD